MKADYEHMWTLWTDQKCRAPLIVSMEQAALDEFDLIRGLVRPRSPVLFRREMGRRLHDVIPTTGHTLMLLSSRIVEALEEAALTGWFKYPVRVVDEEGKVVAGYHGLAVEGRSGPLDDSRCRRERDGRLVHTYGLYFEQDEWDGSDIFPANLYVCVTEKAFGVISSLSPTNLKFIRMDQTPGVEIA